MTSIFPQVVPVLETDLKQRGIIRFHQLKTPVAIFFQPTVLIHQSVRQHPAFGVKPFINLRFAVRKKNLNDNVLFHNGFKANGNNSSGTNPHNNTYG